MQSGGDPLVLCFVDFLSPAHAATAMDALQGKLDVFILADLSHNIHNVALYMYMMYHLFCMKLVIQVVRGYTVKHCTIVNKTMMIIITFILRL